MTQPTHGPLLTRDGARFRVWAPLLSEIKLALRGRTIAMQRGAGGWWQVEVPGARPGDRYAFLTPDGRELPDPGSRRQPDGVHGWSELWDPGRHRFRHAFRGLPRERLVFYELHVGTFTERGTFDAAAARLPELAELGVTCLELLPVQPFPGARNWGYDGVSLHAVAESYGGPDGLQRLVDAAHGAGLGVCLDVVYNHLGPEGNYLPVFGPYFSPRHGSPWGDGMNYDGPEAAPVRAYAVEAAVGWVRDFEVDALRLDAVHAIPDDGPRHLVAAITAAVEAQARAEGRLVHVVAESDLEDRKVVDPAPAGWGCAAMWSDDFHHAVHTLLTGERRAFLADFGAPRHLARALAEGFSYQGDASPFRGGPRGTDTRGLVPAQFVVALQNHDQVGNRPWGERLAQLVPFDALFPAAALLVLGGPLPLLFMGEEYGEERPFLYFTSHGDPALGKAVTEGRRAEHHAAEGEDVPDPQAPETFRRSVLTHRRDGRHGELRAHYRSLLAVRARHVAALAGAWPEVSVDGRCFTLRRPTVTVKANLAPEPGGGLPAWGWAVEER